MSATTKLERYRHISSLGSGGMSTVVLAEDTVLGREVALKRMHVAGDARGLSRLRREALIGASVSHPNLVPIYDILTSEDGDYVIVMEYVKGETLRDALAREGALPVSRALRVLEGVGAGLDAIHRQGVVHRDVKPANVLLGVDGATKLADLGVASAPDRTQITTEGGVVGTFSYMAPEQLGGAPVTPAADVYALSVVAFEVLAGRRARSQSNPLALAHAIATEPPPDLREAWPQAPAAAAELLIRGMSQDPSTRPRSAGELTGRLRAALAPESTAPMDVEPSAPDGAEGERRRWGRAPAAPPPEANDAPAKARPGAAKSPGRAAAAAAAGAAGAVAGAGAADAAAGAAGSARAAGGSAPAAPPPSRRDAPRRRASPVTPGPRAGRADSPARAADPSARGAEPSARPAGVAAGAEPPARSADPGARGAESSAQAAAQERRRRRILAAAVIPLVLVAAAIAALLANGGSSPKPRTLSNAGATAAKPPRTTGTARSPSSGGATASPASPRTTSTPAAGAGGASGAAANAPAAAPTSSTSAGNPISAVQSFYSLAASHRYSEAWALADPTFRGQLGSFQSFQSTFAQDRSISFNAANPVKQSSDSATVAIQTTSVRTDGTQHCSGTVDLSRAGASGWLLHMIHISCA